MLQNTPGLEICNYLLSLLHCWKEFSLQEHAFESSQKYKEGKYIIELVHMIKDNGWDEEKLEQVSATKKTKMMNSNKGSNVQSPACN